MVCRQGVVTPAFLMPSEAADRQVYGQTAPLGWWRKFCHLGVPAVAGALKPSTQNAGP
jgi:hypothetical protein